MKGVFAFTSALLVATLLLPGRAAAQGSNFLSSAVIDPLSAAGWSVTPSLTYSASLDDNVLLRGTGDDAPGDFLNIVNPGGGVNFNGKKGQLAASYGGSFVLYRDLSPLNSYDQHFSVSGRRLLTPHVAIFARNTAASSPTTELAALVAVPFVRTGSVLDDMHGGVEATFTKRTSMVASYDFQYVNFDQSVPGAETLRGGHSHGGSAVVRYIVAKRTTLTAEYNRQHATVGTLTPAGVPGAFDVQNWFAGAEYKIDEFTHINGAAGISRLGVTQFSDSRIGPAVHLGVTRQLGKAGVDVFFSRSFVPNYGFGGTTQNQELTGRFRFPLGRRVYGSSGVSWRSNDPLTVGGLPLRSFWLEGNVGYAATPWVHLEGFYGGTHQTIDRPGGSMNRNRIGFQVTTAKPVRVR